MGADLSDIYEYDFFICHASEDKDEVVRLLAEQLGARGSSVWYDEYELKVGASLRDSIERERKLHQLSVNAMKNGHESPYANGGEEEHV